LAYLQRYHLRRRGSVAPAPEGEEMA